MSINFFRFSDSACYCYYCCFLVSKISYRISFIEESLSMLIDVLVIDTHKKKKWL
uniref:Uncharacterized protein n=1 Tax=Octopus bimaculoides TaxID=37653 RepID=A0A0L8I3S8_OCTBM